ncbi:MAG: BatA and WFA domain-containing protein [Bryobacterales bacterium]|nr:BatA and WFA domain-containing protein [Bryobacterales bacterium]
MFFFNLSAAEFLALLSAISSFVVLLYLLDRSRRKLRVATLRFWQDSEMPAQRKHRRKIQQPWSLILQLIALGLLLLAIAQVRIGSPDRNSRDHVLLVDASAWMGARTGDRLLMEEARTAAVRYVRALPSSDRVMVVRADALATPVTGFESNKQALEAAIRQVQPGSGALNLGLGLGFAAQALRLEGKRSGEIVYSGPGRVAPDALRELPAIPSNLRILPVRGDLENTGVRKLSVRRAANDPELWQLYVTARNYGRQVRSLPLVVTFGGAPVGTRKLTIPPASDLDSSFEFRTKAAGWVEARLQGGDALGSDDVAMIEVPEEKSVKVVVYSAEPELLRPLLSANRRLEIEYRRPGEYKPDGEAGIVILDRFRPPAAPSQNSIWIDPPAGASPIPVRGQKQDVAVRWRSDQFLAAGLRSKDARIESTQLFGASDSDIPIAEVDGGQAILARNGAVKTAVLGFHPMRSALRYELATPLLFANLLKWMSPGVFHRVEMEAGSIGTVNIALNRDYEAAAVTVVADEQAALPFTLRDRNLRFFSGAPGVVRVSLGDREVVHSLSLPDVAEGRWEPPKTVRSGFAGVGGLEAFARDIWYWLAILAAMILVVEWIMFGRATSDIAPRNLLRLPWRGSKQSAERKAS